MGVTGPKKESEVHIKSCMFNKYIEKEKRIVPLMNSLLIMAVLLILSLEIPIISKTIP